MQEKHVLFADAVVIAYYSLFFLDRANVLFLD